MRTFSRCAAWVTALRSAFNSEVSVSHVPCTDVFNSIMLSVISGFTAPGWSVLSRSKTRYPFRASSMAVGEPAQLFLVLWGLWLYEVVRGEHSAAYKLGRQLQALERDEGVPFPLAHYAKGCSQFWLGDFHGAIETLEGAEAQGCVMLEFPSMADARAWYASDAYQEARALRFQGADYRVFITEGI